MEQVAEQDLLEIVRLAYPKAASTTFSTKQDPRYYPAHRFQIDIYVPELRKGIEFDGKYWHSAAGLKRSRPNWTDEQLVGYHDIKDRFFRDRNIGVLHIKEIDWKNNSQLECQKIQNFLAAQQKDTRHE